MFQFHFRGGLLWKHAKKESLTILPTPSATKDVTRERSRVASLRDLLRLRLDKERRRICLDKLAGGVLSSRFKAKSMREGEAVMYLQQRRW